MDNFYDTAKRMYNSSRTLHNNNEFHNSCYLAGYVIECYAKIIVHVFSGGNQSPRSFRHDLHRLDTALSSILSGNSSLSQYILDGSTDFSIILSNWNPVNLRYVDMANSLNTQINSANFQLEVNLAMQKLAQLELDGYNLT